MLSSYEEGFFFNLFLGDLMIDVTEPWVSAEIRRDLHISVVLKQISFSFLLEAKKKKKKVLVLHCVIRVQQ